MSILQALGLVGKLKSNHVVEIDVLYERKAAKQAGHFSSRPVECFAIRVPPMLTVGASGV